MITDRPLGYVLRVVAAALVIASCLFAESLALNWDGTIAGISREVLASFRDPETQWIVFLCASVYFALLTFLQHRQIGERFLRADNPDLWLVSMLVVGMFAYAAKYSTASQSTQMLTLLVAVVVGRGVSVWSAWEERRDSGRGLRRFIVVALVVLLLIASLWHADNAEAFRYRGWARWSGPWDNPNTFGLLEGVGMVLALGLAVSSFKFGRRTTLWSSERVSSERVILPKWMMLAVYAAATVLLGVGLLHSYSRGAWVAVFCGFSYLGFQGGAVLAAGKIRTVRWISPNGVSLTVGVCALAVLAFWQFRLTEHPLARRAFSVSDVNDFSWRNRVAAWEGALQMIAERPWLGFGWNQPESVYYSLYQPDKLLEGKAIQVNDIFMLGTTLGLPALVCFLSYVWLSFRRESKAEGRRLPGEAEGSIRNSELAEVRWLSATCRAAVVVLLVGFWFDGGLFKLPSATSFWMLLELGRGNGGLGTSKNE